MPPRPPAHAGVFAWRQVSKFIPVQWSKYLKVYNGTSTGFMRGSTNTNTNPLVTRYPTRTLVDGVKAVTADPSLEATSNAALKGLPDMVSGVRRPAKGAGVAGESGARPVAAGVVHGGAGGGGFRGCW